MDEKSGSNTVRCDHISARASTRVHHFSIKKHVISRDKFKPVEISQAVAPLLLFCAVFDFGVSALRHDLLSGDSGATRRRDDSLSQLLSLSMEWSSHQTAPSS